MPERTAPLVDTLAERLFYAEMGHTGMTWESLSSEFGQEDYRRKVSRMLEGLWVQGRPFIVLDLDDDEMWWNAQRPEVGTSEAPTSGPSHSESHLSDRAVTAASVPDGAEHGDR